MDTFLYFSYVVLLCSGLFKVAVSTSCSALTLNTCDQTLHVTQECVNQVCVCTTGYVPVPTGCADPNAIPVPKVVSGVDGDGLYSGEVFASQTINGSLDLFCQTEDQFAGNGSFRWYVGDSDTPSSLHLNQVFVVENITPTFVENFRCRVVGGGLESPISQPFVVTGYGINGTISKRPVVIGLPPVVVNTAQITTKCVNIPADPNLTITWSPPQLSNSFEVNGVINGTVGSQCTIHVPEVNIDQHISELVQAVITAPSMLSVSMVGGSQEVVISTKQVYTMTCEVTGNPGLPAGLPSWTWTADSYIVPGQNSPTVTVDTATPDLKTYECQADFGTDVKKAMKKVYIDGKILVESLAVAMPTIPLEGGHLNITCLITGSLRTGVDYSWYYKGSLIPGQTDSTLQMNALAQVSVAGPYSCVVRKGSAVATSPDRVIEVIPPEDASVLIRGQLVRYGIGTTYTFTCVSTSTGPGVSYAWFRGAVEVGTGQTFSYTATDTTAVFKCQLRFGAATVDSEVMAVQGSNIVSVTITGPSEPVIGTPVTYTCHVVKGASAPEPRYQWLQNGMPIPGQTLSTFYIEEVDAISNAQTYGCEVRSGMDDVLAATPIVVDPQAKPSKPMILGVDAFHPNGHYKLECMCLSTVPEAEFGWIVIKEGSDSPQMFNTDDRFLEISNPTSNDEGTYQCRLTIGEKTSAMSNGKKIFYNFQMGKKCDHIVDCIGEMGWHNYYTGNCLNEVCECAKGVPLSSDRCGIAASPTLTPSVVLILVATMFASWTRVRT